MKTRTYTFDLRIGFNCINFIPNREALKDIKSIDFAFSGYISTQEVFIKPIRITIVSVNPIVESDKAGTLVVQCKATVPFVPHFYISDEIKIINMNIEWNNMSDACKDSIDFVNLSGSISYKNQELGYCSLRNALTFMPIINTTSEIHHKFKLVFTGDFNKEYCKDINVLCSINNTKRQEFTKNGVADICGYNIELNDANTILSYEVYLTYADLCELISGNGKISFIYKYPVSKDMIKYISDIKIYYALNINTSDTYVLMHTFKQNDDIIVSLNDSIEESYETVDEEYDHFRARILRQKYEETEPIFNALDEKEALQVYNQLYKYIITAPSPMKYPFTILNKKILNEYTDKELVLLDNVFRLFTGSSICDFLDNLKVDTDRRN